MKRVGFLAFEERGDPTPAWSLTLTVAAIALGLILSGIVIAVYGRNPFIAYATIVTNTLGDPSGWAVVMERAAPLILIGVGLVLAFRAQFYNIGAEGQMLLGAVAASGVALFVPLPAPLALPAMIVAGAAAGAAWGLIPAVLKLRLNVNEVITTLMLNYVAINLVDWLIHGPWKGRNAVGYAYTDTFRDAAWLPVIAGTRTAWPAVLLGVALAAATAFLLNRTVLGYRMRVLGHSQPAAHYAGIDALGTTLAVVLVSAGAAGLAGATEVSGIHHKLLDPLQISMGYGYTGIIIAWLARGNPAWAVLAAIFFAVILAGGDVAKVALQLPFQITNVVNGLILLCLIGVEPLMRYRVRLARSRRKEATAWQKTGS